MKFSGEGEIQHVLRSSLKEEDAKCTHPRDDVSCPLDLGYGGREGTGVVRLSK